MTDPALTVVPDDKRNRCGHCDAPGHNRRGCPELRAVPDQDFAPERDYTHERISAVAELRSELDALDTDIADYERVRAHVDMLLVARRERRAVVRAEIERLRGER